MKAIVICLVLLLLALQYGLWFRDDGIFETVRLHGEVSEQRRVNTDLYRRNQKLISKIYYLKHTKAAVESLAREQIGMVKPGETYYQFVKSGVTDTSDKNPKS